MDPSSSRSTKEKGRKKVKVKVELESPRLQLKMRYKNEVKVTTLSSRGRKRPLTMDYLKELISRNFPAVHKQSKISSWSSFKLKMEYKNVGDRYWVSINTDGDLRSVIEGNTNSNLKLQVVITKTNASVGQTKQANGSSSATANCKTEKSSKLKQGTPEKQPCDCLSAAAEICRGEGNCRFARDRNQPTASSSTNQSTGSTWTVLRDKNPISWLRQQYYPAASEDIENLSNEVDINVLSKRLEQLKLPERVATLSVDPRSKMQRQQAAGAADLSSSGENSLMGVDFRTMSIIPDKTEMLQQQLSNNLPVNQVGEPYSSVGNYLETQFRLLREDCLYSLRQGILAFKRRQPSRDVRICSHVRILGYGCGEEGVEYVASLRDTCVTNLKDDKSFMSGSLLCMSSDRFHNSLTFGVVIRKIIKGEYNVTVRIRSLGSPHGEVALELDRSYIMVESTTAYFGAYHLMLKTLQRQEMENIPFTRYLVNLEAHVDPPSYLLRSEGADLFDFECVFPPTTSHSGEKLVHVLQDWPLWPSTLDEGQMRALKHGLTKELSIIQGPPGTGKTFLGLLLVKLLLANSKGPILVICMTNHALDQFLEGILKFEPKLIRIGGRSKSKPLEARNLRHIYKRKRKSLLRTTCSHLSFPWQQAWRMKDGLKEPIHRHMKVSDKKLRLQYQPELERLTKSYEQACETVRQVRGDIQLQILRGSHVIGITTTTAIRYRDMLKLLNCGIVIVEEAAEVLEGHVLANLNSSLKHMVLIGDHQQLRPSTAVHQLSTKHQLDISMFERLVRSGVEHVMLQEQRRMRPSFSKLVRSLYPGLKDHDSVSKYESIKGVSSNLLFLDHTAEEVNQAGDSSKVNIAEAKLIVELTLYLLKQKCYTAKSISILSMYSGQITEIKKLLKERGEDIVKRNHANTSSTLAKNSIKHGKKMQNMISKENEEMENLLPRVCSVDGFQGEESDIIILSLVRSNDIQTGEGEGTIGFLKTSNRICVALTRARKGMYIFGNATLLAKRSDFWRSIISELREDGACDTKLELYCQKHPGTKTFVSKEKDFKQVRDGGCSRPCVTKLNCGHSCTRLCHPGPHDERCSRPCEKKFRCGHFCSRLCHPGSHEDVQCPWMCEEEM